MLVQKLRIVVLGLSLSSSWGNGHATTWRALLRGLAQRGHRISFLERDVPWYAAHRDLAAPEFCDLHLYADLPELGRFHDMIATADAVIVGSYVPQGTAVGRLVQEVAAGATAFYDIDTPVTLAKLRAADHEYLTPALLRGFDLYLSFTGGPILQRLQREFGARRAEALYCSVDEAHYRPQPLAQRWDLSYLGTYSQDRQAGLERLLLEPAKQAPALRFVVAGPRYPSGIDWPANVERLEHVPPHEHPHFYSASRFTLNLTRAAMRNAGFSPSVRLFEAAACGTPVISDEWQGLDDVLRPGREVLPVARGEDVLALLTKLPESDRQAVANAARHRVLSAHTAAHRAAQLEALLLPAIARRVGAATSHFAEAAS